MLESHSVPLVRPLLGRQTVSCTALERSLTWLAGWHTDLWRFSSPLHPGSVIAGSKLWAPWQSKMCPSRTGTWTRSHRLPRWTCWDPRWIPERAPWLTLALYWCWVLTLGWWEED